MAAPRTPGCAVLVRSGAQAQLRVRGLTTFYDQMPSSALAAEILTPGDGQMRALIVSGGNPAVALPNQSEVIEALRSLELLVCLDVRESQTVALADYALACKLSLEKADASEQYVDERVDYRFHALLRTRAPVIFAPRRTVKVLCGLIALKHAWRSRPSSGPAHQPGMIRDERFRAARLPRLHPAHPAPAGGSSKSTRHFADEESQHAMQRVPSHLLPIPVAPHLLVLLLCRTPLSRRDLLLHQSADVAAIIADALEQLVPERAGAEPRHHGQIKADLHKRAAEPAASHLSLKSSSRGWHVQFGLVPTRSAGMAAPPASAGRVPNGCPAVRASGSADTAPPRSRGAKKPISRPRAARPSNTRSSAAARRMPRCRWASIAHSRPVPKQAAMALKSVLVERCVAVSARWRP